ncbi:hypothetical protein SteCoe_20219 [Stentor coeruleus]|uniref:ATP-grasp domain-containing protein n=1 Tax=Stentor coeruleus TaxID=5963 RepID=A0A1R2BSH1_9CILI|nr:hypothetical protein SteCoe_20219 [Stentor coeruleus]
MNTKVICNISNTRYDLIREVLTTVLDWKISEDENDDWDVMWTDIAILPEKLMKMKTYQRINHFPMMHMVSRKNFLADSLEKIRKLFPKDYSFFPKTYIFPLDKDNIKQYIQDHGREFMIVKPEMSCQGKGIFFTNHIEEINPSDKYVVQEYIKSPYLIDGLKFDLRIYVLVTSCQPLRVYVYDEGLAKFATHMYSKPDIGNITDMFMHLTNYAVNRGNVKFVNNKNLASDGVGHKRSLAYVYRYLQEQGHDVFALKMRIEDSILKTLCAVQPYLAQCYIGCQPKDYTRAMCFEVLGFDIILDDKLNPYIVEVNQSPSFATDSPLDREIKKGIVAGALRLSWVSRKNRMRHLKKMEDKQGIGFVGKITKEYRDKAVKHNSELRSFEEEGLLGKFKRICPTEGSQKYDKFINSALLISKNSVIDILPLSQSKNSSSQSKIPIKKSYTVLPSNIKSNVSVDILNNSLGQSSFHSISSKINNNNSSKTTRVVSNKSPLKSSLKVSLQKSNSISSVPGLFDQSPILKCSREVSYQKDDASSQSSKDFRIKMQLVPNILRKNLVKDTTLNRSSSQFMSFYDTSTTFPKGNY